MTPRQEVMVNNVQLKLGVIYDGDGSTLDVTEFLTAYQTELEDFDEDHKIPNTGYPATRKQVEFATRIEDEPTVSNRTRAERNVLGPTGDYIENNKGSYNKARRERKKRWIK